MTKDPQDRQFGAAASDDQERVDRLAEQGAEVEEVSGQPPRAPRAGNKAPPG